MMEYFRDIDNDRLYVTVGTMGMYAIYRLSDDGCKWEYLAPGCKSWDRIHQKIYRAGRVIKTDPEEIGILLPELPDVKQEIEKVSGADPVPALNYPLTRRALKSRKNMMLTLFFVLREDVYETAFGDGKYCYPHRVFREKEAAQKFIANAGEEWVRFHLRMITLSLEEDRFIFPVFEKLEFDHHSPADILNRFESMLKESESSHRTW